MNYLEQSDIFRGLGILVKLNQPTDFLKVKETLTRIGIAGRDNTLIQSCHILHKRGMYSILHFKELFLLDGKVDKTNIGKFDVSRRNLIVRLLFKWELIDVVEPELILDDDLHPKIKIISFSQKSAWNLVSKYKIGSWKKKVTVE